MRGWTLAGPTPLLSWSRPDPERSDQLSALNLYCGWWLWGEDYEQELEELKVGVIE